ncbi:MAG: 4-alpha-glucanotransferase [Thiohalospira sp.]
MTADPTAYRRAGVLLHLTSLPDSPGNGDLGAPARWFVDWLSEAGFSVWQMLPLGPTHADGSPYQTLSVHAGDPRLVDVEGLMKAGWLERTAPPSDREAAQAWREECRQAAFVGFRGRADEGEQAELAEFRQQHRDWLEDFALYIALREEQGGAPWWEWPVGERDREPVAMEAAAERLSAVVERVVFEQFCFFRQWRALRDLAAERGVALFGDMPIFVALDSADVWARRDLFDLDAAGCPRRVAGVPPDYFSETGQWWGNPLYDWQQLEAEGFQWWLERLGTQLELFDFLRIDHFRGLAAYWAIPAEAETALEGHWEPASGHAFLRAVARRFGDVPLVAEDLGVITADVEALRDDFGLPGMKILQFAFGGGADNPYLPHNHRTASVVYTGTHDNDTTTGWFQGLEPAVAEHVREYLGWPGEETPEALVRAALASVARLAIVPMQDLLGLSSEHRMNVPGTVEGNWTWRLERGWIPEGRAAELARLNALYGRTG